MFLRTNGYKTEARQQLGGPTSVGSDQEAVCALKREPK